MLEDHRRGPRHDSLMSAYYESDSDSGWMISYLDIMTLLVALFVIIIAAAGWSSDTEWFQRDTVSDHVYPASPALEVPLPASFDPDSFGLRGPQREEVIAWSGPGLSPMAISAALGVAGLPRRVRYGVPPLLAAPTPTRESLVEPIFPLPRLLVAADRDDFESPFADYMVVLTDRPPVNVQPVSEELISGAVALDQALSQRLDVSPYLPDLDGVEVSRVAEGISLRVQDQLLFPSATADLSTNGSSLVSSLLETIQRYDGEVWVEGHSDSQSISTDEFSSNWALSSARAIAIVEALEAAGVSPARLRAVGLAATQPLEDNSTAEGRARNRRVEVVIHVNE